jgi:exonuclease SbcD
MNFRFLHAADLHLDTPFSHLTGVPELVARELREASLQAFAALIDTALAEEVAFVVIAGDVYDGSVRGVRAQLAFRDGLQRLSDAGIKTFVAYGNHDPVQEGWSAIDSFPEGVTIFPADSVATVPVEIDGLQVATVSGISYAKAATTDNLALRFEPAKGRGFHVAVLHTNVGGHADHAGYSPCTLDDLRASGHHYWALGHIHRRQALSGGAPHVVYPGNLQGRSTKPSEQGPKGALVVEVSGTTVSETRFVPLDKVRFETVEAEIDDRSLEGLEQALVDAAAEQLHLADGSSVVLRGVIRGRGALHDDLAGHDRRLDLLQRLRDLAPLTVPFVWWDRLEWHTRPSVDLADRYGGDDFVADLLRAAAVVSEGAPEPVTLAATDGGRRRITKANVAADPRLGWAPEIGAEYRNWLGDLVPLADDPELWDEAVTTALDLLLEGED